MVSGYVVMGFRKKSRQKILEASDGVKSVVLLASVREGIRAEKALVKEGFVVRKTVPPPEYRKGCEISIEINRDDCDAVALVLEKYNVVYEDIVPI